MQESHYTVVNGVLDPFWETGTEGIIWAVVDKDREGYEGLFPLRNGDHLTVFGPDDQVVWIGTVDLEYKRNYRPYPLNPQLGQQCSFPYGPQGPGFWVHGFQTTLDPEVWSRMFQDGLRAKLVRQQPDEDAEPDEFGEWLRDSRDTLPPDYELPV